MLTCRTGGCHSSVSLKYVGLPSCIFLSIIFLNKAEKSRKPISSMPCILTTARHPLEGLWAQKASTSGSLLWYSVGSCGRVGLEYSCIWHLLGSSEVKRTSVHFKNRVAGFYNPDNADGSRQLISSILFIGSESRVHWLHRKLPWRPLKCTQTVSVQRNMMNWHKGRVWNALIE